MTKKIIIGQQKSLHYPIEMAWEMARNRHLLMTGTTGSGKTYAMQSLILQLVKNGIPAVVLDYSGSYSRAQLELPLQRMEKEGCLSRQVVYKDRLNINPIKPQLVDPELGIMEKTVDTASRAASLLRKAIRLTDFQENMIYNIISSIIKKSKTVDFQGVLSEIINVLKPQADENKSAASILNKIQKFHDMNIFSSTGSDIWNRIQDGKVLLLDFCYFDSQIQGALIEAALWDLWNYWQKNGHRKDLVIILDEFQLIDFKSNSILKKILTEGRKFGLNLWLSTQTVVGNFDKWQQQAILQTEFKLFFRPTPEDAKMIAKSYGQENGITSKDLMRFNRGECLTVGEFCILDKKSKHLQCICTIPTIPEEF